MKFRARADIPTKIIVTTLFLVSCSGSQKPSPPLNTAASKPCVCSTGIGSSQGDLPVFTLTVDRKPHLAVCGFPESAVEPNNATLSEFDVFDCRSGLSVARYGANESREVSMQAGVIDIAQLISLPAGPHWEQREVSVSHQTISVVDSSVQVTTSQATIDAPALKPMEISKFKRELSGLNSRPSLPLSEWETMLSKLLVCSIMRDKECAAFLRNPEAQLGLKLDSAATELHQETLRLFDQLEQNAPR